jgi:hypothetical protein
MGLFTYVNFDESLLPEKYKDIKEWQTKDVVEPGMMRLKINKRGALRYYQYEKDVETLDFHGDMRFYTFRDYNGLPEWVEGIARFNYGILDYVRIITNIPEE